jgi:hypothetical protein
MFLGISEEFTTSIFTIGDMQNKRRAAARNLLLLEFAFPSVTTLFQPHRLHVISCLDDYEKRIANDMKLMRHGLFLVAITAFRWRNFWTVKKLQAVFRNRI